MIFSPTIYLKTSVIILKIGIPAMQIYRRVQAKYHNNEEKEDLMIETVLMPEFGQCVHEYGKCVCVCVCVCVCTKSRAGI